jgi:Flp pilus assembly pilin Flp
MLAFAQALYGLYLGEHEGQGLVEYALILAFVALLVIVALIFLRTQIQSGYSRIGNSIPTS